MKRLSLLLFLFILTGCPDNPTPPPSAVLVADYEPAPEETVEPLAPGESLETTVEDRGAVLAVLNGTLDRTGRATFELVRSVEAPLYRDLDASEGPRHWITVAEVVDAEGEVLWTDRVNSLAQLLEYLEVVLRETSGLPNISTRDVYNFVKSSYPELLEFAVMVPTGIEGGVEYVLKVPNDEGELQEAARFDIASLVANAQAPAVEGTVVDILESGDSDDRLDIVILGDGYTEDQREKFELDAQAIADRLLQTEPLSAHAHNFNIKAIWTPSNEAGAGYDCTGNITFDAGCKDDLRDTVFETVFVVSALADRVGIELDEAQARVAMPLQVARLYDAAANTSFDEIIMISNTKRRSGFAGLYVSIVTAFDPRLSFPDVAVHEFGHSFGVLGDEYMVEGDPCLYNEPLIELPPNIATDPSEDELKWLHWVDEDAPLPTPDFESQSVQVGAFSGAYNCDFLYRPSHTCKMRSSKQDFCPVCSEQMVTRMFTQLDPVANLPATVERVDEGLQFEVPLRDPEIYTVTWKLGDETVGEGAQFLLKADAVPTTWTSVTAEVVESSGYVRADSPDLRQTLTWWTRR